VFVAGNSTEASCGFDASRAGHLETMTMRS
jgi:hypothetical protein